MGGGASSRLLKKSRTPILKGEGGVWRREGEGIDGDEKGKKGVMEVVVEAKEATDAASWP